MAAEVCEANFNIVHRQLNLFDKQIALHRPVKCILAVHGGIYNVHAARAVVMEMRSLHCDSASSTEKVHQAQDIRDSIPNSPPP
jgi:hypothetical protein